MTQDVAALGLTVESSQVVKASEHLVTLRGRADDMMRAQRALSGSVLEGQRAFGGGAHVDDAQRADLAAIRRVFGRDRAHRRRCVRIFDDQAAPAAVVRPVDAQAIGAARTTAVTALTPALAALAAWPLLNEPLGIAGMAGVALVSAGMILGVVGKGAR